ncbi:prolyl oligopeptidase family serine peptidase [Crateriforma conspicua]|uniref:Prolyl tripeptidyl peptidase n=1 Tax=Crateriforma conspicua TaxID=2527996 RepID=A0A5C5Y3B0_9PLAN|nr:prolyl oligopeptidase family serine peptidase [Crateriforma conspicua]TWT69710.1 Prolyl tripeptidyl peptidase precursor [Crateriforma conspicua]
MRDRTNQSSVPSASRLLSTHRSRVIWLCVLVAWIGTAGPSFGQGSRSDYQRWETLDRTVAGKVFRNDVSAHWINDDLFWYRVRTRDQGERFVVVNAATGKKSSDYDRDQLRDAIAGDAEDVDIDSIFGLKPRRTIASSHYRGSPTSIEFDNRTDQDLKVHYRSDDGTERYYGDVKAGASRQWSTYDGHAWVLRNADGKAIACFVADTTPGIAVIDADTPRPASAQPRRRRDESRLQKSPDEAWEIRIDDHNLHLTHRNDAAKNWSTADGSQQHGYGGKVHWSPDSKHFVVMKTRPGTRREIHLIDSSPDDSHHGKLITLDYAKPGDDLDVRTLILFSADGSRRFEIDNTRFPNPYQLSDFQWDPDSSGFSFLYNQRGHQVLRLVRVNADDGSTSTLIDETSDTFICYSSKNYLRRLHGSDEAIWMSERSGWNHLYLVDQKSGKMSDITHGCLGLDGQFVVRGVEKVDAEKRRLWVKVSGIHPGEDPYHVHLLAVDFDGNNATILTGGDGNHRWDFSPNGRYLIDQYSRVDLPNRSVLRDAETGKSICELETADIRALLETGWRVPERFVAKGRDGQTDIHGIIVRPTGFDPRRKYPVLEYIYAGPHGSFVPKSFGTHSRLYKMAELGFIVVQIDGMGTNHRSKAFHDVCWKNLGDSGFPDRIAWMKAAAETRPEMDLRRVGIWGGSAGGQSALRALLAHGDFYQAAVADCGCHDNRVDKIWWNEQWMGWPIGPHYKEQSNVTCAHQLRGDLMLIVGELDRNVDPISTMQVVDALVRADKDFELLVMPGVGHGAAGHPYAARRQADFFVRKLQGSQPRWDFDDRNNEPDTD